MKKCPNCSVEAAHDASWCMRCGRQLDENGSQDSSLKNIQRENRGYKIFKITVSLLPTIGIVLLLVLSVASFVYMNARVKKLEVSDGSRVSQQTISPEETSVRRAFDDSMNFRLVGNCDSVADSVSKADKKIREEWGERCRKEKVGETAPISDITISRLSIRDDKAFIQANLTRAISLGENITYTGTYDLILEDGAWRLMAPSN